MAYYSGPHDPGLTMYYTALLIMYLYHRFDNVEKPSYNRIITVTTLDIRAITRNVTVITNSCMERCLIQKYTQDYTKSKTDVMKEGNNNCNSSWALK